MLQRRRIAYTQKDQTQPVCCDQVPAEASKRFCLSHNDQREVCIVVLEAAGDSTGQPIPGKNKAPLTACSVHTNMHGISALCRPLFL
eukprot:COSAG02_NODE_3986_length_5948_cov_1.918619_8_plen_87_part_00